jgi:hypothetical protein
MLSSQVLKLAELYIIANKDNKDITMLSSAKSCYLTAKKQFEKNEFESAKMWSLKTLAYIIGIGHHDYIRASK